MSSMDLFDDEIVEALIIRKTRLHRLYVVVVATVVVAMATLLDERRGKRRRLHQDPIPFYKRVIYSNDTDCHDQIRMSRRAFFKLVNIIRQKESGRDTVHITLEEQLVMFLHTLGHSLRNRKIAHNFGHFGEMVSRHFHNVLTTVLALHADFVLPPSPNTPPEISGKSRFDPYFKDCVGAIDGSHIPVSVDVEIQAKYRDRKGNLSQNFMGVTSFDYKFQYILARWEGSAVDSRVLASALSRADPLVVPPGKYYLVDAGYPNVPGFLAPYRCTRYHLRSFQEQTR